MSTIVNKFPLLDWRDDRWEIIGRGTISEYRCQYVHLASTTRFRQQRNGKCPIQMADWIPVELLPPVG